jgi:uncharacterized protein (TIGR00645 family)
MPYCALAARRRWSRNYNLQQPGYPEESILQASMVQVPTPSNPRLPPLPNLIFASRWLQLPLYLGLILAQAVYVFHFWVELSHLIIMLVVLALIDVVMISNLLIMVIVGGYETFVSRMRLEDHPDQPEWLSHVNASVLKVKLATAIIGISSIHLLKTFINAENYSEKVLLWQTLIHITFLLSALAIAATDRLMPHGRRGNH